jgi:hypothetical protein
MPVRLAPMATSLGSADIIPGIERGALEPWFE